MHARHDDARPSIDEVRGRTRRRVVRWVSATAASALIASTLAVATDVPADAAAWECPQVAPVLYRLIIDDGGLQREADRIGLCSDAGATFFVLNNTSSQPIRFWSSGSPATFSLIPGTAPAATEGANSVIRSILVESGDPGNFVLAGEAIEIDIGPQQFVWDFDAELTLTVTAVSTAGALAFDSAKKWWSRGSKVRAAVATCASAALELGATVQDMDDVVQGLLLGGTACAAKVEAARGAVDEGTVLQRANRFQSTLGKAKSFVRKIEWTDVVGRIIVRAIRR